jgi:hypothetical protein
MKVFRWLIFILIFTLCLIAGFNLGSIWQQDSEEVTQIANTPHVFDSPDTGNQHNILIIGIDQINNPKPSIHGLWLLIYYRDTPQIDLIPIFPSIQEGEILQDQTLAGSFAISSSGDIQQKFWEHLQWRNILWHNYVLLDENALNEITRLVQLPNARDSGLLVSWEQDSIAAVTNQSRLLDAVCHRFEPWNLPEDITPMVTQLTPHLMTDISSDQIIADWRLMLSFGEKLHCEFPTLTP